MQEYTHIIWDFNGTILDDIDASIKSENALLARRGLPLIDSVDYYRTVFTFPIIEYYKNLGHTFEEESYDDIARQWVKEYNEYSKECGLNPGVRELLEYFRFLGLTQVILSATEQKMLKRQVEALGISDYFRAILGLDNIHAFSKVHIALKWLEAERPGKALVIGDTVHDYEVARELKSDCILVAAGHQSETVLRSCGVPVYSSFLDLKSAFGSAL